MREKKIAEEGFLSLYCGFDAMQVITSLMETAYFCVSIHIFYNSVKQFNKRFINFKTFE